MNSHELICAIKQTSRAITQHQQQVKKASRAIARAITPPEPYVYALPIVAFLLGLRYAKPCSTVLSVSHMYTYGMMLLPLLKE